MFREVKSADMTWTTSSIRCFKVSTQHASRCTKKLSFHCTFSNCFWLIVSLSFSHDEYFINVSHSAKFFLKFENKICKQKFGHGIYNLAYLSFLRGRSDWVDLTLMVLTLLTSDMSLVSETSLATSSDMSGLNSAIMPPRQIHRSI